MDWKHQNKTGGETFGLTSKNQRRHLANAVNQSFNNTKAMSSHGPIYAQELTSLKLEGNKKKSSYEKKREYANLEKLLIFFF